MALSIGIKRGSKILLAGTHLLEVQEVVAFNKVRIKFNDRVILVTDLERVELLPDAFVSCGVSMGDPLTTESRLAFEAPRSIRIERIHGKR